MRLFGGGRPHASESGYHKTVGTIYSVVGSLIKETLKFVCWYILVWVGGSILAWLEAKSFKMCKLRMGKLNFNKRGVLARLD